MAKAILSKEEQCWRYHNTRLQIILQSHSNKNNMALSQKTGMWTNGMEDPEISPHSSSHLIFFCCFCFYKKPKTYVGKDSLFNKHSWENWIFICRRLKLDPYILPYTKSNSKWIKTPNVRPKTLKVLLENT
jgi:hypothetical protein